MSGAPSTTKGYTQQPPAYGYGAAPTFAAASSSAAPLHAQAQEEGSTAKGSRSWNPFGSSNKGQYSAVPQGESDEATAGAAYADEEAGQVSARHARISPARQADALQRCVSQPPKYDGPVADASPEIRAQFLKKTYSILFLQILLTTVVSAVLKTQNIGAWVEQK
jgi:hypothetical protein